MICLCLSDAPPESSKGPDPCAKGNFVSKMVKSEWRFRLPRKGVVVAPVMSPLGGPRRRVPRMLRVVQLAL